ncbi:MAG: DUF4956 domain-containing protein [Longimicrobiales bacterium]
MPERNGPTAPGAEPSDGLSDRRGTDQAAEGDAGRRATAVPGGRIRPLRRARAIPVLRLLIYYGLLIGIAAALMWAFPPVRDALMAPLSVPAFDEAESLVTGAPPPSVDQPDWRAPFGRALTTAILLLGALLLVLPVAWIYIYTRRLRYDPSLVQSIIILPLVVAAVVVVVRNSLALAFSLAGIVAAVRFRNTLKDPKDAAYIFLAIGIGLSSGVQALDIALVMSGAFNLVILVLWKYDLGAIYSASDRGSLLALGDARLLTTRRARDRKRVRDRVKELADGIEPDGVLIVHAADADAARRGVEITLGRLAKEWRVGDPYRRTAGVSTFEAVFEFNKKRDALDLLVDLEERWSAHIAAAEYIPYEGGSEE